MAAVRGLVMSKRWRNFLAGLALAIFALVLISTAVYLAPRCKPGEGGTKYGGMLMAGCMR
jgi:hypothetical protein